MLGGGRGLLDADLIGLVGEARRRAGGAFDGLESVAREEELRCVVDQVLEDERAFSLVVAWNQVAFYAQFTALRTGLCSSKLLDALDVGVIRASRPTVKETAGSLPAGDSLAGTSPSPPRSRRRERSGARSSRRGGSGYLTPRHCHCLSFCLRLLSPGEAAERR